MASRHGWFLDGELSRYAMGLPARLKIKRLQKKWILRRSLRGIVPDDILDGKKTGFSVPYGYWLRKPLASFLRSTVLDGVSRPLFDRQQLVKCLDEHAAGRGRHGFLLHKLFNLALWHGQYVAGS